MNDEKDPLADVNTKLQALMSSINTYFQTEDAKPYIVLFFEDKKKSPSRRQTEDIEPDVTQMRAVAL
jgi:hypothetical protein